MKRTTGHLFTEHQWALLIGISNYHHFAPLPSAVPDVEQLKDALSSPVGGSIPTDHIINLLDQDATCLAIGNAIRSFVSSLSANDTLSIYFAGHGLSDSTDTFLCGVETDPSNLRQTGLSARDIDKLLAPTKARGVLFIVDCCGGAGFAENAPQFFHALGDADFRILLSASRARQNSWERRDGRGTIFSQALISILKGELGPSSTSSLLYFSELLAAVQHRMNEDISLQISPGRVQDCVFTGVYSKDPLVFVRGALNLGSIDVRTARYSRQYIRRITIRVVSGLLAGLIVLLGTTFTALDHSEFAGVNSESIMTIYSGIPGINAFGFPKVRWTLGIPAEYASVGSPLRHNKTVQGPLGVPVLPTLVKQLRPEARALVYYWMKDTHSARMELEGSFQGGPGIELGFWGAPRLYAILAERKNVSTLLKLAGSGRSDVRVSCVIALLQMDVQGVVSPALAFAELNDFTFHHRVLTALRPPRNSAQQRYISGLVRSPAASPNVSHIVDAALRLDLKLEASDLLALIDHCWTEEDFRHLALFLHASKDPELVKALIERVRSRRTPERRVGGMLLILAALDEAPCLEDKALLTSPDIFLSSALLIENLHHCSNQTLNSHHPGGIAWCTAQAWCGTLRELANCNLKRSTSEDLGRILDALSVGHAPASEAVARSLLSHRDSWIRLRAVRLLKELAATPMNAPWLLNDEASDVQEQAFAWLLKVDPGSGKTILLARISDASAYFSPRLLASIPMTNDELSLVRAAMKRSNSEALRAAAILSSHAEPSEVLDLLRSPNFEIRNAAADMVAANPAFDLLQIMLTNVPARYPSEVETSVDEQYSLKREFQNELNALDPASQAFRVSLALEGRRDLSEGLSAWLESFQK